MSFLNRVRLSFAGTFQADVSTVNNDVRHYDNATFRPSYQDLQRGPVLNGWWNPEGSGAFRLIDCRVTGVWYEDGSSTTDSEQDPAVGMWIGGSSGRTAGKLVDIDPQWQLASAPWGLEVRLTDGQTDAFAGRYRTAAFRDLWFSRLAGSSADGAASSTFQSVLDDLAWAPGAGTRSRFLAELQAATGGGALSVRLATFGYQGSANSPRYTLGTVVGTVGPQLPGEPISYVGGRRFTPASQFSSWNGVTYFSGLVDEAAGTLFLDLSNALPIVDGDGTPQDIGAMTVGILRDPTATENTPVTAESFEVVAEIPYTEVGWLQASGGVVAAPLTPEQLALARDHPLALVTTSPFDPGGSGFDEGGGIVAIRESAGGYFVEAEPAVHRIDAGKTSAFTVRARRYGAPLPGAAVQVSQVGRVPGQGGGSPTDPDAPMAPIPDIGVPIDKLGLHAAAVTGSEGDVEVTLTVAPEGPGNPRGYIDGQIYLVDFRLPGQSDTARQPFDFVVVHARDAYQLPERPTWDDVAPVLTQYANLYPIMSQRLFDLADETQVLEWADLLHLSFSLDPNDPNHMPVTRDLSEPKRQLILRWLEQASGDPAEARRGAVGAARHTTRGRTMPPGATPGGATSPAGHDGVAPGEEPGAKTQFAAGFQRATRGARRR